MSKAELRTELRKIINQNILMRDAISVFVECVEVGEVRSVKTYYQFKSILSAINDNLEAGNTDLLKELSLMLDVFNSCITTRLIPEVGSDCQKKIVELMKKAGREPTTGGW